MCLKITIEAKGRERMPKIWITCPLCKHKDWYYSLYIGRCDFCGAVLTDIRGIYMNLNRRLEFHSDGV